MSYYFSKVLKTDSFDKAVQLVKDELKKEGFGVLSEIDVKETLKKSINAEIKPYNILGACHPQSAYEALMRENKIGTMLPCNFIVQKLENGSIEVAGIDPIASMISVKNENLGNVALRVREKIQKVIENID